jgi:hypothetical protein
MHNYLKQTHTVNFQFKEDLFDLLDVLNIITMKKQNNLVIIDADSMIYIIGSELEHLQLEPLGIMKIRRVYFRYSYHYRIKRLPGIHRR